MLFLQKRKIKKEMKNKTGATFAETLAKSMTNIVDLPWNGQMMPFEIHEISFMDLMQCGKFPNLLASYIKPFEEEGKKEELSKEEVQKIKKEQDDFFHELARKSMVSPTYAEAIEAIRKYIPAFEEGDSVIPRDFLLGLYGWYLRRFNDALKKNLKESS